MNALIRSAQLAAGKRKIAARERHVAPPTEAAPPTPPAPPKPSPSTPTPAELAAREQQAWRVKAEAELAAAREREEKAGHAEGYAKGLADGQAAYREKLAQLERMLAGFGEAFDAQVEGVEDIAVAIGFEAAVKILGEAMVSREGVRAVVAQALSRVRTDERLLLRVSPRDFYLLLQQPGDTLMPGPQNVEMVPDDRMEPGSCLVETASGTLDARLDTQLEALRRLLIDLRQRKG